ncbi:unnamed protein product, partial [Musa acuminata subsp. burmannicoides]
SIDGCGDGPRGGNVVDAAIDVAEPRVVHVPIGKPVGEVLPGGARLCQHQGPSSFSFKGAWLFNYGIGIHLLQCNTSEENLPKRKGVINPKDNHISFQCSNMKLLMLKLKKMGVEYVTAKVEEEGIQVDQLFFHDPDGNMIEICNCDNLPVLPLSPCRLRR